MSDLVRYHSDLGVAVLTLNHPPRNRYTHEAMRALDEAILRARFDDDVHVVVLTGEGDECFSEGVHLEMMHKATPRFRHAFEQHVAETLARLEQTPKLVIGALNGSALAGGLEIALACDLRIGRQGEARLGFPEVSLGVLPASGGVQRLIRIVGRSRALELLIEGTLLDVEQAHSLGILNRVLPSEGFREAVLDYARSFCPPGKASRCVGVLKRACRTGADLSLQDALTLDRELQGQLLLSQDAREGLGAHLEDRTPAFQGI